MIIGMNFYSKDPNLELWLELCQSLNTKQVLFKHTQFNLSRSRERIHPSLPLMNYILFEL